MICGDMICNDIKTDMWCGNADHSPDQWELITSKPVGLPIRLPVWYGKSTSWWYSYLARIIPHCESKLVILA